jgi:hypothetical protein
MRITRMKIAQSPKRYIGKDRLKIERKGQLKRSVPRRKRKSHDSPVFIR